MAFMTVYSCCTQRRAFVSVRRPRRPAALRCRSRRFSRRSVGAVVRMQFDKKKNRIAKTPSSDAPRREALFEEGFDQTMYVEKDTEAPVPTPKILQAEVVTDSPSLSLVRTTPPPLDKRQHNLRTLAEVGDESLRVWMRCVHCGADYGDCAARFGDRLSRSAHVAGRYGMRRANLRYPVGGTRTEHRHLQHGFRHFRRNGCSTGQFHGTPVAKSVRPDEGRKTETQRSKRDYTQPHPCVGCSTRSCRDRHALVLWTNAAALDGHVVSCDDSRFAVSLCSSTRNACCPLHRCIARSGVSVASGQLHNSMSIQVPVLGNRICGLR